ncbi:mitochondrial ATP-independent inner membrane protease subunit 1a [Elaeis guineensis]|uniref:Mitochondrial inner membrane protease subunit 1 n=1 Tax=Elaeis guineensis var. tenera TaxID=51953 RepID=A0A6I9SAH8_ELAGV|nr:mitochondrial inner membrane protease subunit 1 [Elaeis guineensis]XP_029124330.1 mitochondrial inner membrane protease subunit 1 [Elaeis guineensis]XP_029124331.1 mitochondrial inner membrane protease subunit 1 [Elaeis guineensis]
MAVGSRAAVWLASAAQRFGSVPWRDISAEAVDRTLLVIKAVCFAHVINSYVVSLIQVRGPSMLPTMNLTGDIIAVDRVTARRGTVAVGDVVLFRSPENPRRAITKRVLGLEGDAITYLVDPHKGDASKTVVVPNGHAWVQGDNIYDSRDSRHFGPVPYGLIQGRVFYRVWPPEGFGFIGQKATSL